MFLLLTNIFFLLLTSVVQLGQQYNESYTMTGCCLCCSRFIYSSGITLLLLGTYYIYDVQSFMFASKYVVIITNEFYK